MELNKIYHGHVDHVLKTFPDKVFDTLVTSPPYYALRDYDLPETSWPEIKWRLFGIEITTLAMEACLGLEPTPEDFIGHMVYIMREAKRTLKDEATAWINIGDSYWGGKGKSGNSYSAEYQNERYSAGRSFNGAQHQMGGKNQGRPVDKKHPEYKPKDLIGIPWMLAFALRSDGWHLRSDIIWCLSGGAYLYVKSQKGVMPMMVKDMVRLKPETIQLWNGDKWTNVLGFNENLTPDNKMELVLRSGERIGCTGEHIWPTNRGNVKACDLKLGDVIKTCVLPEPENAHTPGYLTEEALWFVGLYLAEGSKSEDTIQISGHAREVDRLKKVQDFAKHYGGYCTHTIKGNGLSIRVYGKVIYSIISQFISGKNAHDKCLSTPTWNLPNESIRCIIDGYLHGDGHWDEKNQRWRLGFCRNYNLERDLRLMSSRLGGTLTLSPSISKDQFGNCFPSFKGELRWERSGHFNEKDKGEVIAIRRSKARRFYDISVEDEPHLFSLSSGVLTHNCKPNPMPESVYDRPTKAHEYIFLLSKQVKYYYDADAIREPRTQDEDAKTFRGGSYTKNDTDNATMGARKVTGNKKVKVPGGWDNKPGSHGTIHRTNRTEAEYTEATEKEGRNKRSVWPVATAPFAQAHFATFPEKLIVPCIKAGCPEGGIVLDIFMGAGTTGLVARKLNRNFVGIDLSKVYIDTIANPRLDKELGMFK